MTAQAARDSRRPPLGAPARRGLPRVIDLALADRRAGGGGPLLLVAAMAIKLDSRGPVIYRQPRVGQDGETFELYKLRTMRIGRRPGRRGHARARRTIRE